jgi:GDPmannose 4,6-dehydratase
MSNGILFNHESEMRGEEFVTRKIAKIVAEIANGSIEPLIVGNMEAKRDWGHASDYTEAMWAMLQQPEPDDFVIATGQNHSVREFIEKAFGVVGIQITWNGEGVEEIGVNTKTGQIIVRIDPKFFRPAEVDEIRGNATKAKQVLGWEPRIHFTDLVRVMVQAEIERLKTK